MNAMIVVACGVYLIATDRPGVGLVVLINGIFLL